MKFFTLTHQGSRLIPFQRAWEFQKELVEKRARDEIEDTVLFLEHTPVVTQGRGLQWTGKPREKHMPLPEVPEGTEFFEIERGGDLTWHGPGQLVVYPIVKLDGSGFGAHHDVTGYLRKFEKAFIQALAHYDLLAEARESATGVWVGDQKIASIGIAVKKWVTYHGLAVNAVNDLTPFYTFSPCGFSSEVMTSIELLRPGQGPEWRPRLEQSVARAMSPGAEIEALSI